MSSAKFEGLQVAVIRGEFCEKLGIEINERKAALRRPLLERKFISGQELYKRMADFIENEMIPRAKEELAGLDGGEEIIDMLKNDLEYRLDLIGRKIGEDQEETISMDDVERSKTNFMLKIFEYPSYLIKKYKEEETVEEIQEQIDEVQAISNDLE